MDTFNLIVIFVIVVVGIIVLVNLNKIKEAQSLSVSNVSQYVGVSAAGKSSGFISVLGIIIIVIILIMIFKNWLYDPYTLKTMSDGKIQTVIQPSALATSTSSSNFAYSIWFYVDNWNYKYGEPKVIFGRMGKKSDNTTTSVDGISGLDPCPAVVLGAVENNLAISLGCFPGINEKPSTPGGNTIVHTCAIGNVPIQKWVNLTISVYNRSLDVYVDGKLVKTCLLPGIANVNDDAEIYVTPMGGFDGWTSNFKYYPNALNPQEAWNIYSKGYSNWYNFTNTQQLQISVVENGNVQSSVTI